MDTDSAEEIRRNEEKIMKEEELIKILKTNHKDMLKMKTDKVQSLEAEEKLLNIKFLKIRKDLKVHLALDEKQLRLLTATSNQALEELNLVLEKGRHVLALSITCKKFETDRERISKWLPIMTFAELKDDDEGLTDDQKLIQKSLRKGFSTPKLEEFNIRPQTSSFSATFEPLLSDSKVAPIEDVKIESKKIEEKEKIPTNFLNSCYENLEKLENFWMIYNKCEIDVMELKQEKATLEKENKQLRGLIRAVLEAAVLAKSAPDSKVSTRVQSKRRSAYSAPLHRITF
ncbi:unnamed protein product [Ceutorhynchus assimilis]|uniref:Uncharacterized protein n=1 Tax=Ceutorhynchus assimilis TaxID=467358 RepID=A0A9N9QP18_9CUCU|nr:unnamed protein product [Ceutorhynchus assimilis]